MGVDLGAQEPALLLSSLMVILPFGALSVFKLCCEHSFCGTLVCLKLGFVLGKKHWELLRSCLESPTTHSLQTAGQMVSGIPASLSSDILGFSEKLMGGCKVFRLWPLLLLHLALSQHFVSIKHLTNIE